MNPDRIQSSFPGEPSDRDSEPLEQELRRREVAMEALGREEKHIGNIVIAQNCRGAFDGVASIGGGHLRKLERADLIKIRAHRMPDDLGPGLHEGSLAA